MGTIAPTGVGAIDFSSFNEAGWDNPPYRWSDAGLLSDAEPASLQNSKQPLLAPSNQPPPIRKSASRGGGCPLARGNSKAKDGQPYRGLDAGFRGWRAKARPT